MNATIRLARESDADRMLAIYAPIVRETAISFELTPPTTREFQDRITRTLKRMPWLVCEIDGQVSGYAYAIPFRTRPAYQWTAESVVYIGADRRRKGVGSALYTALLGGLRLQGFRSVMAGIAQPNPASVRFHERFGYRPVGVLPAVGYKLGTWRDVGWWQLSLADPLPEPLPPRPLRECLNTPRWQESLVNAATLVTL